MCLIHKLHPPLLHRAHLQRSPNLRSPPHGPMWPSPPPTLTRVADCSSTNSPSHPGTQRLRPICDRRRMWKGRGHRARSVWGQRAASSQRWVSVLTLCAGMAFSVKAWWKCVALDYSQVYVYARQTETCRASLITHILLHLLRHINFAC